MWIVSKLTKRDNQSNVNSLKTNKEKEPIKCEKSQN